MARDHSRTAPRLRPCYDYNVTLTLANAVQYMLLENPWPVAGTLLALAVVLFLRAGRAGDRKAMAAFPVALGLAGAVVVVAWLVVTRAEEVRKQTADLIKWTVQPVQGDGDEYFDPNVALIGPQSEMWLQGDDFLDELNRAVRKWNIRSNSLWGVEVEMIRPDLARVVMHVRTVLSGEWGERPVHTDWRLTLRRDAAGGEWRVQQVEWLKLSGQEPNFGIWR